MPYRIVRGFDPAAAAPSSLVASDRSAGTGHGMIHDAQPTPAAAKPVEPATGVAGLRRHTATHHRRLEATPLAQAILSPTLDLPGYRRALTAWADAWWPLEQAVVGSAHATALASLLPPPRHALALADLQTLSVDAATAPARAASATPPVLQAAAATPAGLLGLCYVLCGAALGGQVIAAHLHKRLGLHAGHGAAFFGGCRAGMPAWPAWCATADRLLSDAEAAAQSQEAAALAFETLRRPFSAFQPEPATLAP